MTAKITGIVQNGILIFINKNTKKATGYDIEDKDKEADGFIHIINSGACCLDANGIMTP